MWQPITNSKFQITKLAREDFKIKTQIGKLIALSVVIALVAIAALLLPAARVDAQTPTVAGQGKIEGKLVNGTKDAKVQNASTVTVTLLSAAAGVTAPMSQTTKSDADGKFSFANLDATASTRYLILATYLGVEYATDVLTFPAAQTVMTPTITVHETTNDVAVLRVMQSHLVIEVTPRAFNIIQIVQVVNESDRALVGATATSPTLRVPVLAGAQDIQFERFDAGDPTPRDGALAYSAPFVPGMDQVVYNYTVPFTPPTYQFALKMPSDVGKLRILLSDTSAKISSAQLAAPTIFPTQGGQNFLLTTVDNLKAGTEVKATFENVTGNPSAPVAPGAPGTLPTTQPTATTPDNTPLIAGVAIGGVGLIALGLIGFIFRKRQVAQMEEQLDEERRVELLQELADLDDEYEEKKISEEDYKRVRAALKTELRELMNPTDATEDAKSE
ncbi:MAG: hypothetical protein HZC40_16810 [Chloroflexi bacterium]|nr:hypothetical protein [Chloroflexota bacterium]